LDISQSVWTELDASNSTAAPDGAPEGMAPSGVNDTIRADRGAIKRWYNRTIPLVTGGSSTAYTLSYSVAPTALADGDTHLVQFNAINGAAPTLNVNSLGAKPLHFWSTGGWGAWPANMVAIDQIVPVTYNSAAGTYRAIGLPMVLRQAVSAASSVDFIAIPTNVENLDITFDLLVSTNNVSLSMQFYNSAGVLDGGNNYTFSDLVAYTNSTTLQINGGAGGGIFLGQGIQNNSIVGCSGDITIQNIQAAKATQCNYRSHWNDQTGAATGSLFGGGYRGLAGNITGIRLIATSGNVTGKVTVRAK
jgi:hypothetical protein